MKFFFWPVGRLWIVRRIANLGETWWKPWLSVIIKLFMAWLSSPWIIRLFPYLDYHESVILQKTSLKGLILIIKSTYQGWYHSLHCTCMSTVCITQVFTLHLFFIRMVAEGEKIKYIHRTRKPQIDTCRHRSQVPSTIISSRLLSTILSFQVSHFRYPPSHTRLSPPPV